MVDQTKVAVDTSKMEQTFSRFSDLPVEIRLLIWEELIEPQVVHLRQRHISECYHAVETVSSNRHIADECCGTISGHHYGRLCESQTGHRKEFDQMDRIRGRPWNYHAMGFATDSPTPALLLACRESHQVASKVYTRSFSSLGSIAQTYFNFKTDTLFLDKYTAVPAAESLVQDVLPYMCQDELAKVEKLALNHIVLTESLGSYENYLACILYFFKNVKTVYLISEPELVELDRVENAKAGKKKSEQNLIMHDAINMAKDTSDRICADCRIKLDRCGVNPSYERKIRENKLHAEGRSVCGGRGREWCNPILVYDQTITTPEMKSKIEKLWRECRNDRDCRCADEHD